MWNHDHGSESSPRQSINDRMTIVSLTREYTELRRQCEIESKAKKALEEENVQLRARLSDVNQPSEVESTLKRDIANARLDLKLMLEANRKLTADVEAIKQQKRILKEQAVRERAVVLKKRNELLRQLSEASGRYEEEQVAGEAREIGDKERYEYLVRKYSLLADKLSSEQSDPFHG